MSSPYIVPYPKNRSITSTTKLKILFSEPATLINTTKAFVKTELLQHEELLEKNGSLYTKDNSLDDVSISEFLSQGYVMHPNTYYKNIKS